MEAKKSVVKTNKYGQAILTSDNLRELLLHGKNISHTNVIFDEEIELFNKFQDQLLDKKITFEFTSDEDMSFDEFQTMRTNEWVFPQEYQHLDVSKWLLDRCKTEEEISRVKEEYRLYEERELIMLLRLFIFLVEYMRKNKFVWGVGRGSSVSSFILYLIGIHKVNPLVYGLDIRDYLK